MASNEYLIKYIKGKSLLKITASSNNETNLGNNKFKNEAWIILSWETFLKL